jgi:hypothetical protein
MGLLYLYLYCRILLTFYGHIKQYKLNIRNARIAKLAFRISYIHKNNPFYYYPPVYS